MTIRSIVIGLLMSAFLGAVIHFNDQVIRQTYLIGCSVPIAVLGVIVVLFCLVNPLLRRIRTTWALRSRELAVVAMLMLAACSLLSGGLLETFPSAIMLPNHYARTEVTWRAENITDDVPDYFLVDGEYDDGRALDHYLRGAPREGRHISISDVPWRAWLPALSFWLPTVLVFVFGLIGLSIVVHRQWSRHEHLPYPIPRCINHLIDEDDEGRSTILRNKIFWIGFTLVCLFHLNNYLTSYFPDYMIRFPNRFNFVPLAASLVPLIHKGGGNGLFIIRLSFALTGLAFLLPRDVSFSLGIGPYLYAIAFGILTTYGIPLGNSQMGWFSPGLRMGMQAGAYIGMFVMIIYTGRSYYSGVFKRSLRIKTDVQVADEAVMGARLFMICSVAFCTILVIAGVDWLLAILFTVLCYAMYLAIGRVIAESGYIFIQPFWAPVTLLIGFFGYKAMGWQAALLLLFVSAATMMDTREPLIGYFLNGFKLIDSHRLSIRKGAKYSIIALVVALAVAVPVTLYLNYDEGNALKKSWASYAGKAPFQSALAMKQKLSSQGVLDEQGSATGLARLIQIRPDRASMIGFGTMFLLFLGLSALRLRIPYWPLHPVLLLVSGQGEAYRYVGPYLLGCAIKHLVLKYGGEKVYKRVIPIFIGMIAGEMGFGLLTTIVGAIYYFVTGTSPPSYWISLV